MDENILYGLLQVHAQSRDKMPMTICHRHFVNGIQTGYYMCLSNIIISPWSRAFMEGIWDLETWALQVNPDIRRMPDLLHLQTGALLYHILLSSVTRSKKSSVIVNIILFYKMYRYRHRTTGVTFIYFIAHIQIN